MSLQTTVISDIDTITCRYSCELCGATDIRIEVPIREKDEGITDWMKNVVMVAMCIDHGIRAPSCKPKVLTNITIPVSPGSRMVGRPTEH